MLAFGLSVLGVAWPFTGLPDPVQASRWLELREEEWPELFGNPLSASAGLDRLTHGAQVVIISGASFWAQGPQQSHKEAPIEIPDQAQ
jgi:hypothetical protein